MACAICETRRPRRACPGVGGDICAPCCGAERENTVDCPLECEFLREARRHERAEGIERPQMPYPEVEVTESFLRRNEELVAALGRTVAHAALETQGAVDSDVADALDSLAKTYRTLQSGVYYETRPSNPFAARIYGAVERALAAFRRAEQERQGVTHTRDADVLGALVFLARVETDRRNGRRRGRAFIDFLRGFGSPEPEAPAPPPSSPLIVP